MLRHYSKKSEKKYNKLVKLNPNMKISATRYFEWCEVTVIEFTCKYGHITERQLRQTRRPILCQCDKCKADRGVELIKSDTPTVSAEKYKSYKRPVTEAARKLANKYIRKHKLDIPTCLTELKKRSNNYKRLQYQLLVAKHTHEFYYQYDTDKIFKEIAGNAINKMTVTCPEHGEFKIRLSDHCAGTACPECYKAGRRVTLGKKKKNKPPTKEQRQKRIAKKKAITNRGRKLAARYIIENNIPISTELQRMRKVQDREKRILFHLIVCQMVHNFYYEYDLNAWLEVGNIRIDKVPITCPEHGEFYMKLSDHYSGSVCPKCSARGGKGNGRKVNIPLDIEATF